MPAFAGKVALITGGAGGIGSALARALAESDARVAVTDVDVAGAKEVAGEIGGLGVEMDVADSGSVARAVGAVNEQLGSIGLLFNVAGIVGGHGSLLTLPVEVFDRVFAINARGMLLTMRAVAPQMIEAGRGAIVNVGSVGGLRPGGPLAHYGVAKAAVHALTTAAARELAPHGIRVNAIAPGPVYTPMTKAGMDDPAQRAGWESRIPLRRIAETGDMVPLLLYLASDEARNITGTIVSTDGGLSL